MWVATHKVLGQDPGGWAVIDPVTLVNGLQHTSLVLTWSDGQSDRPDPMNWQVMSSPSTYMFNPNCTFKSALAATSKPLSFKCYKAVAEGRLRWEDRNLTSAENLKLAIAWKPTFSSSILIVYPHLNQGEWVSSLVHSQHKLDSGGCWSQG